MTPRWKIAAAIGVSAAVAGVLDNTSALATFVPRGAGVAAIMKYLASGLAGKAALSGGADMVALGYAVHFGLMTIMATIYVLAALRFPVLRQRPALSALIYGVLTYVAMNYVAVPLSAAPGWKPPSGWAVVNAFYAHLFYVGVTMAFFARYFLGAPGTTTKA